MRFELRSLGDATKILEHFNHFHDGFIRSFLVSSRDHFEKIGCQRVTGQYDAQILFAHYNFGWPSQDADTRVEAKFYDVCDVVFDLRVPPGHSPSGSIGQINVTAVNAGSPSTGLPKFVLSMTTSVCRDNTEWTDRESRLFEFSWAEFRVMELDGDGTPSDSTFN